MAVTEQTPINSYTGNGSSTVFPYSFRLLAAADLVVQINGTTQTLGVHYTVSGVGNDAGGDVTFTTAPGSGLPVVVFRDTDLLRATDYQDNGDLLAAVVNRDFDRLWMALQDIYGGGKTTPSALRVPNGETVATLPNAATRANRLLGFDGAGAPSFLPPPSGTAAAVLSDLADAVSPSLGPALVAYTANLAYSATSVGGFLNSVHGRTAAEISAGVTPTNYSRPERDPRRYGGTLDGVASDQTALAAALNVADEVVGGSQGSQVVLPQGTARMTATLNIPNRVGIVGVNKRGSTLQAAPGFTGTYMLTANNGLISMFDNALEKCNLDCNDIAGLGAVLSDAWQEGGGMRSVLINKFRTYGVRFQNGYGGASNTLILDSEIFGSASGATAGIRVDTISAVGAFKLTVQNTTIAGGGAATSSLPRAIDVVNDSTVLINVHFEVCQTGVYLDGAGDHLLIHCDGAGASSLVDTLVTIASTFTGTLTMIGCKRNGATNFLIDNRVGGLGTITGYDIPVLTIGNNTQAIRADSAASAWVVFDGTGANGTKVPSASYNVSNVNKTATGSYRVTLSRAMKSVNACAIGDCNLATAATHVRTVLVSSTTFDLFVYTNGVLTDSSEVKGLIFGG